LVEVKLTRESVEAQNRTCKLFFQLFSGAWNIRRVVEHFILK
jgi:hypothetical protein